MNHNKIAIIGLGYEGLVLATLAEMEYSIL